MSQISRTAEGAKVRYRIAVKNFGLRDVADINVACRVVSIQGLNRDKPRNWTSFHIPVADDRPFPVIDFLRVSAPNGLASQTSVEVGSNGFPMELPRALRPWGITLEELLSLGEAGCIPSGSAFSGSHEVGGLRRTASRRYTAADVIAGRFVFSRRTVKIAGAQPPD